MQHNGNHTAEKYFYLHDRLGSVRQIIDPNGKVVNRYMYQPFGVIHIFEKDEVIDNSFKFTGQYYDSEIDQYYLRARQYYPRIQRFTARDPVAEAAYEKYVTLPIHPRLTDDAISYMADCIAELSNSE
jgi:RHS repeat-associated protein